MSDLPHPADHLLDHADFLRRLANHLAGPDAGDDLVQDAWLHSRRHALAHTANVRGWFAAVVANLWRNRTRDENRRRAHHAAARRDDVDASAADIAAREEVRQRVVAAVLRLPDEFREVVLLHYYEGLDSRAIGEKLGLSGSAVRTRLQAARDRLRTRLDDDYGGRRAAWAAPFAYWRDAARHPGLMPLAKSPARFAVALAGAAIALGLAVILWAPTESPPSAVRSAATAPGPVVAAQESATAARAQDTPRVPPPDLPTLPMRATTELRPMGTLQGVLTGNADATGMAGFEVVLKSRPIDCSPFSIDTSPVAIEQRVTTGSAGTFEFASLPIGAYDVDASGPDGRGAWLRVHVPPGATRIELRVRNQPERGHVTVHVRGANGQAVPDADVILALGSQRAGWFGYSRRPSLRGRTDASGTFALRDRPELAPIEEAAAVVSAPNGDMGLVYRNESDHTPSMTLLVTVGPPASVRGRLTGLTDWRGVEVAAVPWLGQPTGADSITFPWVLLADGSFRIDGLPAGQYWLQVGGMARRADKEQFWNTPFTAVAAGAQVVAVPAELACVPGSAVRGVVHTTAGRPVAGARVVARRRWFSENQRNDAVLHHEERGFARFYCERTAGTDANGHYALVLHPGDWQILVSADGLATDTLLHVMAGSQPTLDLVHALDAAGNLGGVARELTMCHIASRDVQHHLGEGVFLLRGLRVGTWELTHTDQGTVIREQVVVQAGKTLWLTPLPDDARVHRGVLRHAGKPLADHDVRIGDRGAPVRTDANGGFVLNHAHRRDEPTLQLVVEYRGLRIAKSEALDGDIDLPGAIVTVRATAADGSPLPATFAIGDTFDDNFNRYETYHGPGRTEAPDGVLRFLLTDRDEQTTVVATFADGSRAVARLGDRDAVTLVKPAAGNVLVRVVDADGNPGAACAARVLVWGRTSPAPSAQAEFIAGCADDGDYVDGTTAGDGTVHLPGVPAGVALLTVHTADHRLVASRLVTVDAGRTLAVDVRIAN